MITVRSRLAATGRCANDGIGMAAHEKINDRFLREKDVHSITGLSRTTRWRLERENKFPSRRQISGNAVGWLESELTDWIANRPVAGAASVTVATNV